MSKSLSRLHVRVVYSLPRSLRDRAIGRGRDIPYEARHSAKHKEVTEL